MSQSDLSEGSGVHPSFGKCHSERSDSEEESRSCARTEIPRYTLFRSVMAKMGCPKGERPCLKGKGNVQVKSRAAEIPENFCKSNSENLKYNKI